MVGEINWLDIIIVAVFVIYGLEGILSGFINSLFDFFSFILSFVFGISFYSKVSPLLTENFSMPQGISNALAFFLIAFITELLTSFLFKGLLQSLYNKFKSKNIFIHRLNKAAGFLPAFASSYILLAFLLSIIVSLPLSPYLKNLISSSKIGNAILSQTQGFESRINSIFGGAINDTLNFFTVEPQSDESVKLNFKTTNVSIDSLSEKKMLEMINKERNARGLKSLVMDESLVVLAREYAKDMLARGYFSHYTPEGLSPFDRMGIADISFTYAGENLAFSPNVEMAMQGLMQSKGHRENILSSNFGKVGIGVIDSGIYGEMFVQEFTN